VPIRNQYFSGYPGADFAQFCGLHPDPAHPRASHNSGSVTRFFETGNPVENPNTLHNDRQPGFRIFPREISSDLYENLADVGSLHPVIRQHGKTCPELVLSPVEGEVDVPSTVSKGRKSKIYLIQLSAITAKSSIPTFPSPLASAAPALAGVVASHR
jgi:hypothetical protein